MTKEQQMSRPRDFSDEVVDWLEANVEPGQKFSNLRLRKGLKLDGEFANQVSATLVYLERAHLVVTHCERGLWRFEGRVIYDERIPGGHDRFVEGEHAPTPVRRPKHKVCPTCHLEIPLAMTECEVCG